MSRTIQEAAKQALECQDACNLSGIVRAFDTILMETLWPEAHRTGAGTDWVNTHPISRVFIDKFTSLAGTQNDAAAVYAAFEECETLAAPPQVSGE